jgi:hypothetical protein
MKFLKIVTILGYVALVCLAIHFIRSIIRVNNDFLIDSFNFREGMTLSSREKDVYNDISDKIEKKLDNYKKTNTKPLTDFVTSLPEDFKGTLLDLMEEKDKMDVNKAIKKLALKAKGDEKSAIGNIMKELHSIKEDNMELYDEMRTVLNSN